MSKNSCLVETKDSIATYWIQWFWITRSRSF